MEAAVARAALLLALLVAVVILPCGASAGGGGGGGFPTADFGGRCIKDRDCQEPYVCEQRSCQLKPCSIISGDGVCGGGLCQGGRCKLRRCRRSGLQALINLAAFARSAAYGVSCPKGSACDEQLGVCLPGAAARNRPSGASHEVTLPAGGSATVDLSPLLAGDGNGARVTGVYAQGSRLQVKAAVGGRQLIVSWRPGVGQRAGSNASSTIGGDGGGNARRLAAVPAATHALGGAIEEIVLLQTTTAGGHLGAKPLTLRASLMGGGCEAQCGQFCLNYCGAAACDPLPFDGLAKDAGGRCRQQFIQSAPFPASKGACDVVAPVGSGYDHFCRGEAAYNGLVVSMFSYPYQNCGQPQGAKAWLPRSQPEDDNKSFWVFHGCDGAGSMNDCFGGARYVELYGPRKDDTLWFDPATGQRGTHPYQPSDIREAGDDQDDNLSLFRLRDCNARPADCSRAADPNWCFWCTHAWQQPYLGARTYPFTHPGTGLVYRWYYAGQWMESGLNWADAVASGDNRKVWWDYMLPTGRIPDTAQWDGDGWCDVRGGGDVAVYVVLYPWVCYAGGGKPENAMVNGDQQNFAPGRSPVWLWDSWRQEYVDQRPQNPLTSDKINCYYDNEPYDNDGAHPDAHTQSTNPPPKWDAFRFCIKKNSDWSVARGQRVCWKDASMASGQCRPLGDAGDTFMMDSLGGVPPW